jgi:hypothetical protein
MLKNMHGGSEIANRGPPPLRLHGALHCREPLLDLRGEEWGEFVS